nr:hypothetical protein CFP56_00512 [Quercus suber]
MAQKKLQNFYCVWLPLSPSANVLVRHLCVASPFLIVTIEICANERPHPAESGALLVDASKSRLDQTRGLFSGNLPDQRSA